MVLQVSLCILHGLFLHLCYFLFYIIYQSRFFFLIPLQSPISLLKCCLGMIDDMFDIYILLGRMQIASFLSVPKTFPPFSHNTFLGTIVAPHQFSSIHYTLLQILTFQRFIFLCYYSLYILWPHEYFKSNSIMITQPYKISPASILFITQVLLHFLGLHPNYPPRFFFFTCLYKL